MQQNQIKVRQLNQTDLIFIEKNFPQTTPLNHRNRLQSQERGEFTYLCAESNSVIAGIVLVSWGGSPIKKHREMSKYPEIIGLYIIPKFRGRGIATILENYAETIIGEIGYKGAGAAIKDNNQPSVQLNTKRGYRPVGKGIPTRKDPDLPRTYYVKEFS